MSLPGPAANPTVPSGSGPWDVRAGLECAADHATGGHLAEGTTGNREEQQAQAVDEGEAEEEKGEGQEGRYVGQGLLAVAAVRRSNPALSGSKRRCGICTESTPITRSPQAQ